MSASFGQPGMSERIVSFKKIVSPTNVYIAAQQAASYQNSTNRHANMPSDKMGSSQGTEPARNPDHIGQAAIKISRKPSDFSFASGSL